IGADVSHLRRGHGDNLADVARVGEDFLVAGHRGVEHHLADALTRGAEGAALEHHAVGQGQGGASQWLSSCSSAPSKNTGRPPTKVWTTRPTIRISAKGVFRLREWKRCGSTVQSAA